MGYQAPQRVVTMVHMLEKLEQGVASSAKIEAEGLESPRIKTRVDLGKWSLNFSVRDCMLTSPGSSRPL